MRGGSPKPPGSKRFGDWQLAASFNKDSPLAPDRWPATVPVYFRWNNALS